MLLKTLVLWYIVYLPLAIVGATYGLHRYWAHQQGPRDTAFEWISLVCSLFLGVYKPLGWIGIHRLHHKYSDSEKDPHCPKFKGWKVLVSDWSDTKVPLFIVRDIVSNPRIRFFQKYGKYLIWPIIVCCPLTILYGYIGIGVLNYFGHSTNGPQNKWYINIFAPFEGNHYDHHSH